MRISDPSATFHSLGLTSFPPEASISPLGEKATEYTSSWAPREGLIDADSSIQIGIRTDYERDGHEFEVIGAHQANEQGAELTVAAIRARVGDNPAYLTFDIDALDPAYAPGTGTPVVGGMTTSRVLQILEGIADLNIVGFDVVEVSPPYDNAGITALAGATLALQYLYMRASRAS